MPRTVNPGQYAQDSVNPGQYTHGVVSGQRVPECLLFSVLRGLPLNNQVMLLAPG